MLYTIGYEGAELGDFVATLKAAGIETLVDVRELAISRRKGFAKKALSEALGLAGIEYLHLKGLGDPKPGREAARAGDYKAFKRIFSAHMKSELAQEHLSVAEETLKSTTGCLMCYERDPLHCHRAIVADTISETLNIKIRHLGVQSGISEQRVAAE